MTKILNWKHSDDPRDVVHLAVQALTEGHIVALPSSNSYLLAASGLQPDAVAKLNEYAKTSPIGLSLAMRAADETLDYFPDLSSAARRLANKSWPGPVMISLKDSHPASLVKCMAPSVSNLLMQGGERIHVWQPHHEVLEHVGKLFSGPLVCALATGSQKPFAPQLSDLQTELAVLAIDDGATETPGIPTIVQIDGNQGQIVHQGIVGEDALKSMSQWIVLFVCTGNTCRSPMAQAMMQRKIAERFSGTSQNGNTPVVAISAGVSAFGGEPASHGAAAAIKSFGTTLDQHQSTQLNSRLVEQADLILAMGNRHRQVITSQWPAMAHKVHLISPDGNEISDPFGGPLEIYQRCASQLDQHTSYWIDQLNLESLIQWR